MMFTEYTLDNTPINARIAHNAAQMYLARIKPQRPGHVRWSSSKSTSTDERRALVNLACRYAQTALLSEGHHVF